MSHWKLGLEFGHKDVRKEDVQTVSGIKLERKKKEDGVDRVRT